MISSKFYHYISVEMILGKNSPEIRNASLYKLDLVRSIYKGLKVVEVSTLDKDGRIDRTRTISFQDGTSLSTSHISLANDLANIVTYVNNNELVSISDLLYSEEDFNYLDGIYNKYLWSETLAKKINQLSILIRSLNESDIDDIPLVMNDFPNIVEVLFIKSGILIKD